MNLLNFIVWDVDPAIFEIAGREIRYYGLFFAIAFMVSQYIMNYIYKKEGEPEKKCRKFDHARYYRNYSWSTIRALYFL